MDGFVIRTISRRGSHHSNRNEDSLLLIENDRFIHAFVFDGCSSGENSHFASSFISNIAKNILRRENSPFELIDFDENPGVSTLGEVQKEVLEFMHVDLGILRKYLNLEINELLSTIIYLTVDKINEQYSIRMIGDGCIFRNDNKRDIDFPDNAPPYLAYFLDEKFEKVLDKSTWMFSSTLEDLLVISTDGITSFNIMDEEKQKEIEDYLFNDKLIKSKAMFDRKCNILSNQKVFHQDDLTMIMIKRIKQ